MINYIKKFFTTVIFEVGMFLSLYGNTFNIIVWVMVLLFLLNGGCHFSFSFVSTPTIDNVG